MKDPAAQSASALRWSLPAAILLVFLTGCSTPHPLRGGQLRSLAADRTPLRSLSALSGMPIETLRIRETEVTDLSPLRGMPLDYLELDFWLPIWEAGMRDRDETTPPSPSDAE